MIRNILDERVGVNAGAQTSFVQVVGAPVATVFDTGTVTLTVNGVSATASYDRNASAHTIAQGLAGAFATASGNSPAVTIDAVGDALHMTATATGGATNYAYSVTTTYDAADFSAPSFSFSAASGNLAGGADSGTLTAPVYTYQVGSPGENSGYAPNGNLLSYSDSVMGAWSGVWMHAISVRSYPATAT